MTLQRDFWMPQFEVQVIEELGQEWPTGYAVSRWEQNAIGERRYTGQTRTYTYLDRDALARALPDVMSQEVCDAVMGRGHDPLDLVEEWYMTPRELADAIIAALREQS